MKTLTDLDLFILFVSYCYYGSRYVYDFNKIIAYFLRGDDSTLPGNRRKRYKESFQKLISLGFFKEKDDHYIKTGKFDYGNPIEISMDDIMNMNKFTSLMTFYGSLRIYALIISKMDSSDMIPEKYRGKIVHLPTSYLAKKAGKNNASFKEYIKLFAANKVFYGEEVIINKKKVLYISRYEDKKLCKDFIKRAKRLKTGI